MEINRTKFLILIAGLITVLFLPTVSTMPMTATMPLSLNLMAQGPTTIADSNGEQALHQLPSLPDARGHSASIATPRLSNTKNPKTDTVVDLRDLPQDFMLWGDIAGDKSVVKTSSKAVVKIHDDNSVEFALQATCKEALPTIRTFLRAYQIPVINEFPSSNIFTIKMPVGWIDGVANRFLKDAISRPDIQYIGPNTYVRSTFIPNDPDYVFQWGHHKIGLPDAWDVELGESSITIAVLDSGIDYNHPDLRNNYVIGGYDWVNFDATPFDDNGHGTHCAGIIAAVMNNSLGVAGVANLSLKAEKMLNQWGYGSDAEAAAAIDHAVLIGADILSCSWGDMHSNYPLTNAAIDRAINASVIIVAAAGNHGTDALHWPASRPDVIGVGATNIFDQLADFSAYGTWVDVTAPGVDIFSTVPNNGYGYKGGTSMATPYVAGLAGLLMSHYPSYSVEQIQWLLRSTTTDLGDPGKDQYFGWGRINASNAINGLSNHNLRAWSTIPDTFTMGFGSQVYGHAANLGLFSEPGVSLLMYVNGTLATSTVTPSFDAGTSLTLPFHFQPTTPGVYNITFVVDTVSGESDITDNRVEHWISVTLPRDYIMEARDATWLDAFTYGTNIGLQGDDGSTTVALPFSFSFYGRTFDTLYLSTNGWLSFTNPSPWQYWPRSYPNTDPTYQYAIAPFWYDLEAQNNVFTWLTPTHAVIAFMRYSAYWGKEIGTFQVVLYPNGTIVFNYLEILRTRSGWLEGPGSPPATVGLNLGLDESYYCSYPADDLWGVTNFALRFTPVNGTHELHVALQTTYDWTMEQETEKCVVLNQPKTFNLSVTNLGTTDEANVDLRLYINNLLVTSQVIPLLASLNLYTMNYTWIPSTVGPYNITAYAVPVSGEFLELNNKVSRCLDCVSVQDYLVTKTVSLTWYDAVTNGYQIMLDGSYDEFRLVVLPFSFPFYDKTFDYVYVSNNGWLSFHDLTPSYFPTLFPCSEPEHHYLIAPFWSYLRNDKNVYIWSTADWLVIQYDNCSYGNDDPCGTFEVVLHADGHIEFHYQELLSSHDEGVVGLNYGNGLHCTTVPLSWVLDTSHTTLSFAYQAPHDVTVSAGAPSHLEFLDSMIINATICNRGMVDETDLDFFLYIDDALVATDTISLLPPGGTHTLQFPWAPMTLGTYNITVSTPSVLNETRTVNNIHTVLCTYTDTMPPIWVVTPTDQLLLSWQSLFLQLNATDPSGVTSWTVNNTRYFTIDPTGLLRSYFLPSGTHALTIAVTDTFGNTRTATITVTKLPDFPVFPFAVIALLTGTLVILVLIANRFQSTKTLQNT